MAAVFGLAFVFVPAQMLGGFGFAVPGEAVVVTRDVGATLIGLAVINWMARGGSGPALRAVLVGNVVVQAAEIVVNDYEIATDAIPSQAAGGIVIHVALGAIFGAGSAESRSLAPRPGFAVRTSASSPPP